MAIHERNMIVVAVMFAILEKITSMLGKLNLIWATTVLLGAYASGLERNDFVFVSVILAAEGIRFFGRRARRAELHTISSYLDFIIQLYSILIQEVSAVICFGLSFVRLKSAKYGPIGDARHRNLALKLFYWVSMVESVLILLGILLTTFSSKTIVRPLMLENVRRNYGLDASQISTLNQFFYNTYSRCISGSIFDSSKITIVSYSVELLQSSDGDEQLMGAGLLSGLVKDNPRALERLRSIGTMRSVVEILVDMLNWDSKESPDKGIRLAAAESIKSLVQRGRNRTLVMATPNSMQSIASLLDDGNQVEYPQYPYSDLSKVGLFILKELANYHDNRAKMGSNRGLLLKIITLTESNTPDLHLKKLAIETLTSFARDQDFREIIGYNIDRVLNNFFSLFLRNNDQELVIAAGEALVLISLENHHNLPNFPNLVQDLINVRNDQVRSIYAVVWLVMEKKGVHQEAAIGLAAQIFKFPSQADYELIFGEQWGAPSLISKLRDVIQQYASPSKELPNIRRFSMLLLIAVMRMDKRLTIINGSQIEKDLTNALEGAMNTTSVLESYSTFSGTVGLRSHRMSIPFLAQSAMELLHPVQIQCTLDIV